MRLVVPFCLFLLSASAPLAQDTAVAAPPGTAVSKGVYTTSQADRGEKFFAKVCVECHETIEFSGSQFDKEWLGKTAFDFFDLVKTTMPDDKPGTLNRPDILDVMAYIFKLNTYPAGQADLPDDDEKLKLIQIDARPTPPSAQSASRARR
ncbi:MAG TPA: cytochrome c [Gemmatimonadaceae bacterium]|nr:cytochrome c [Gemmatimonadaceae bacterium]